MRKQKGFSLIELLIVVAIILIIAAIAIPNLLRARIAANESSAAASVRTLATGNLAYANAYQVYSPNLAALGPGAATGCPSGGPTSAAACIIDYTLSNADTSGSSPKSGYYFNVATPGTLQYVIFAQPATQGSTGVKGFCAVEDNVVRFSNPYAAMNTESTCTAMPTVGN